MKAREELDAAQDELDIILADPRIARLQERTQSLTAALNAYVLDNHQGKEDAFEVGDWRGTPVRANTVKWNIEKLQKLAPKNILLKIVDLVPNSDKIDEQVRAGRLDPKLIAKALEETPKAPFVKWTKKQPDKSAKAKAEADSLAEMMG